MTKKILETPKIWLSPELCKIFYDKAPTQLSKGQPLPDFSSRFDNRLESILGSINGSFGGSSFYPTIQDCAAGYLVKLNCGHPFTNGNKRTSIYFTDLFLFLNGVDWRLPLEDAYITATRIAIAYDNGMKEEAIMSELKPYLEDTCFDAYIESESDVQTA